MYIYLLRPTVILYLFKQVKHIIGVPYYRPYATGGRNLKFHILVK